jgi:AsmA protein
MDQTAAAAAQRSGKALKYALVALAVFVLASGALVAYIAATFDPRDLHPRAIELVREKTGRTLEIRGETALSFWPDVGVRLNGLVLSERGRPETFASIEGARVRLELVPLLNREIVASELVISGARINVVRDEEGRLNIADLLEGEGDPPRFELGRVAVERSTLTYRDLASGAHYELADIALEAGRVAPGAVSPVSLAAVLGDADGTFGARFTLKTRLGLDFDQQRYALDATRLEVHGSLPGLPEFAAKASADAIADGRAKRLEATAFQAGLSGKYAADDIAVTASAARLVLAAARMEGENVRVTLAAKGPAGTTEVKLELSALMRDADKIAAAAAVLDLDLVRGNHRVHATVSTPLEGGLAAREVRLDDFDAAFTVRGPRLPRDGIAGAVTGEASLDATNEGVKVRLAGRIGESRVKAQLAATGFASPVYRFTVDVNQLDLDRYARGEAAARKSPVTRAHHLLEPLEDLPASGTLTIGTLRAGGVKASRVRLELR